VFSVAEREKAAICGWFTQLGTRICWRMGSQVTAEDTPQHARRGNGSAPPTSLVVGCEPCCDLIP
jgi:hypothetical protein